MLIDLSRSSLLVEIRLNIQETAPQLHSNSAKRYFADNE